MEFTTRAEVEVKIKEANQELANISNELGKLIARQGNTIRLIDSLWSQFYDLPIENDS